MILSKQIAQASISTTGAIGQVTIQSKQILQISNWLKLQSSASTTVSNHLI